MIVEASVDKANFFPKVSQPKKKKSKFKITHSHIILPHSHPVSSEIVVGTSNLDNCLNSLNSQPCM